jgi:hypothetical protein
MHPDLLHQLARAELHDRLYEAELRRLAFEARNGAATRRLAQRRRRSLVLWRGGRGVRPAPATG